MFAQLPSPDLAYEMFKLQEKELLREAELNRLIAQRRASGHRQRNRLMVMVGKLLLSLGARLRGPVPVRHSRVQPTASLTTSQA